MTITLDELTDAIGYIDIHLIKAKRMLAVLHDPNASASDKTAAKAAIIQSGKMIYKIMNTLCQLQGIKPPTTTFTTTEIDDLSLNS